MIAYWLIVLHLFGDYVVQSDWMANAKTKASVPALAHAVTYTVPFWLVLPSWQALLLIGGSHFVIDRWRLARYVCWAKNFLGPREEWVAVPCENGIVRDPDFAPDLAGSSSTITREGFVRAAASTFRYDLVDGEATNVRKLVRWRHPWSECVGTGYHSSRPAWLSVWLMIIADNTLHLAINGLAYALFSSNG